MALLLLLLLQGANTTRCPRTRLWLLDWRNNESKSLLRRFDDSGKPINLMREHANSITRVPKPSER